MAVLRGKLVSFDATAWTAVVRLDGSAPMEVRGIAVNLALESADMNAGDVCLVDTGGHGDPADAILTAVVAWGFEPGGSSRPRRPYRERNSSLRGRV